MTRTPLGSRLPDFPWDTIADVRARAASHEGGLIDLSVGGPVDPVAPAIQLALSEHAAAPGYPQTAGTPELRATIVESLARRFGIAGLTERSVLPVIGLKEAVAWLPTLLGLGPGDIVGLPAVAYPTYVVGARLAGATPQEVEGLAQFGPPTPATTPKLLWINSPGNPTGRVLGVDHLRKVVAWARRNGVIVASDECYAELDWRTEAERGESFAALPTTPSILDPRVTGGSHEGLLAVYSTSKQSNLAGYRAAFTAGDPVLIGDLTNSRKHAGMIVPGPVQTAMIAGLTDTAHVEEQKERYRARRAELLPAVEAFGLRVDHSDAGLYLWARRDGEWKVIHEHFSMPFDMETGQVCMSSTPSAVQQAG